MPDDDKIIKIKTGLTIATARIIPKIKKRYRCHMTGHKTNHCRAICLGKELCRKCGSSEHDHSSQ